MIRTDKKALICDLAEVYNIYDYRSLPARLVATFSVGLREDSRIMTKLSGTKVPRDTFVMTTIADTLLTILRIFTGTATDKSPLLTEIICGIESDSKSEITSFETASDFEAARQEIIRKGGFKWQNQLL